MRVTSGVLVVNFSKQILGCTRTKIMHLLLILILGVFKPTALMVHNQSPKKDSESFELHGDRLGESLTTFVSKHPKAECKDSTKTRTNCYQWTDVSIFGMLAHPHP